MPAKLPAKQIQFTVIGVAFIIVHLACFQIYGGRPLDDAIHYVKAGDLMLNTGELDSHFHAFYFIPVVLMAAFRYLFGDPTLPYICFQVVCSALAVVLLYRLIARSSQQAAFTGALLFVLWLDNIRWNVVIMTESLFGSIVVFVLYALATYKRNIRHEMLLLALVALALFTRPTGILVAVAVIIFFIHRYADRMVRARSAAVLAAAVTVLLMGWAVAELSQTWDFTDQYFRGNVVTYADTWAGDRSYIQFNPGPTDPTKNAYPPLVKGAWFVWQHPGHMILVSVLKLFYLLSGVRPYYSSMHNIFAILWMGLIYIAAVRGFRMTRSSPFKTALCAMIACNCLLVVLTTVDWDNRFYVPMEASVLVFAAIGSSPGQREEASFLPLG